MQDGIPKKPLSEDKKEWHYFGQYKIPLLYACLLQNWADGQDPSLSLAHVDGQIALLDGHLFCLEHDWNAIRDATSNALADGDARYFADFFDVAEKFTQDLGKGPIKNLETFLENVHALEYSWFYLLPMAEAMEAWLRPLVPPDDLPGYFTPYQTTLLGEYEQALAALARMPDAAGQEEKARAIAQKYAWVGFMHFWGKRNSVDNVLESLKDWHEPQPLPPAVSQASLPVWICDTTRKVTFYRQYFAELCAVATGRLYDYFDEHGISSETALWLTPEELLHSTSIDEETLKERKKAFGLFNVLVTGPELARLIAVLLEEVRKTSSLAGVVASKGYAKGAVKVLLTPSDASKLLQGDILVAHETTPDLVPAMRRAAAIVTDIGGLTSHAAIVSRELGKPCIIGTKVATRIFKDGDMVEVDANKGVVKIIS